MKKINKMEKIVSIYDLYEDKDYLSKSMSKIKVLGLGSLRITAGRFDLEIKSVNGSIDIKIVRVKYIKHEDYLIIPEGVTSIKPDALGYIGSNLVVSIRKIYIPSTMKIITPGLFLGFDNLNTVIMGDGVEIIDTSAFSNCYNLKTVRFGTGLRVIGDSAFECCENLKTVIIKGNLERIGIDAFLGCKKLRVVGLSECEKLKVIDRHAFKWCTLLSEITFNNKYIENSEVYIRAFCDCTSLKTIDLSSFDCVDDLAFVGCDKLKTVYTNKEQSFVTASNKEIHGERK